MRVAELRRKRYGALCSRARLFLQPRASTWVLGMLGETS
jgi:hypothetical protein